MVTFPPERILPDPRRVAAMERASTLAGVVVMLTGIFVLAGWLFDVDLLKRVRPGLPSMKANTAICFAFAGAGLLAMSTRVTLACAAVVLLVGAATGAEYVLGTNLGIDELLFSDASGSVPGAPGRMAPSTVVCTLLAGVALSFLAMRRVRWAHVCGTVLFTIAFVATVGYIFGVTSFYQVDANTSMALHTSFALVVLGIGIVSARPTDGLSVIFASHGAGGLMVRRVLPLAIVGPVVVAWLERLGAEAGLYDRRFAESLAVVSTVTLLGALIVWTAHQMFPIDLERREAQQELQLFNVELEGLRADGSEFPVELSLSHWVAEGRDHFTGVLRDATERVQGDQALGLLASVVQLSDDAIYTEDVDTMITSWNPGAERLYGYSAEEAVGRPMAMMVPAERTGEDRDIVDRILAGERIVQYETERIRKDGSTVPVSLTISALSDDSGSIVGMSNIARDITEVKAAHEMLKERETFYRVIAENVSDVIVRVGTDGRITYASPSSRRLLGYEPQEMIGGTAMDFIRPEGAGEVERIYEEASQGRSGSTQQPVLRKDGSIIWLEGIANPILDPDTGVYTGTVWIIRDVTGHIEAFEHQREIARRHEELNELKNEFVGIVAHDLKSPMTVIGGFADILISNWSETSDHDRRDFLRRIRDNISRLSMLVDDVLQVARIESGEVTFNIQPFDFGSMVYRTVGEMRAFDPARPIEVFMPDELPPALGDEERQWRILTNLLSNAFKFSDPNEPVGVCVRRIGDDLEVSVSDRGDGIRPEDLSKLFQKFSRVQQPGGRWVKGTGLGLYICRSLVEGQGGRIWAESSMGAGTTFSYTVPVAAEPA